MVHCKLNSSPGTAVLKHRSRSKARYLLLFLDNDVEILFFLTVSSFQEHKVKNIEISDMGEKLGRIHMTPQVN